MAEVLFYRIGYGNFVQVNRVLAMVGPDSAPVKRMVQVAKDLGTLIDATAGHKTRTVFVMDTDHIVLSAWEVEKVMSESENKG